MRHEAILKLYPNVKSVSDAFGAFDQNHNVVEVDENLVQEKVAELQAEYDAQQYQRDRAVAYPTWQEQMDMQYHDAVNGTNTWQEAIEAVKTKFPKGE